MSRRDLADFDPGLEVVVVDGMPLHKGRVGRVERVCPSLSRFPIAVVFEELTGVYAFNPDELAPVEHICHLYPQPPGPGDRAYCGRAWTPEDGAACNRHGPGKAPICVPCDAALYASRN